MQNPRKQKQLSEMSLDELWRLFPIELSGHQNVWNIWYEEEATRLIEALPDAFVARISHIGSTAIGQIKAKAIVDILLEAPLGVELGAIEPLILQAGYLCMRKGPERIDFNKGYTPDGFAEKVFHLHLAHDGDNDELYFRDYLNERPEIAHEYEKLKEGLADQYRFDRDGYTQAKTSFIMEKTAEAKALYPNRYRR